MRNFEKYNCDEYFIKFLTINPILLYTEEEDKYNIAKLNLQKKLIEKFNNKELSKDKLIDVYNEFIDYANKKKKLYSIVQLDFIKKLKELKISNEELEINKMKNLIESLD